VKEILVEIFVNQRLHYGQADGRYQQQSIEFVIELYIYFGIWWSYCQKSSYHEDQLQYF
jgi:hypothetical protein